MLCSKGILFSKQSYHQSNMIQSEVAPREIEKSSKPRKAIPTIMLLKIMVNYIDVQRFSFKIA